MLQNEYSGWISKQSRANQLQAIDHIAALPPGGGRLPSEAAHSIAHIGELANQTSGHNIERLSEEGTIWDQFFPSRDIPIIHHMFDAVVQQAAREKLGL